MKTKRWIITCNAPDCRSETGPYRTAHEARQVAVSAGWERVGRLDFCPDHADR